MDPDSRSPRIAVTLCLPGGERQHAYVLRVPAPRSLLRVVTPRGVCLYRVREIVETACVNPTHEAWRSLTADGPLVELEAPAADTGCPFEGRGYLTPHRSAR